MNIAIANDVELDVYFFYTFHISQQIMKYEGCLALPSGPYYTL